MKFTCLTVYLHSANMSLYAELEASYYICLTQRHPLQIPLELYATVQNFMHVPNFYEKHLAPMQSIENSKHQHFPLLLSKLNGHSPSHCHAYRYDEKDNYLFKFARWTSTSFHVLCTYVSKFISHSTNLRIFRTTRYIFRKFPETFEYFVECYRVTRFIERIDPDLCRDKDYNFFVAKLAIVPLVIDRRVIKALEWMAGIAGAAKSSWRLGGRVIVDVKLFVLANGDR